MAGKGDRPRPVDKAKYEANYDRIFGKKAEEPEQPLAHKFYECDPPCPGICAYCTGGLAFCTVCRKAEAELEENCPGPSPYCECFSPRPGKETGICSQCKKEVQ